MKHKNAIIKGGLCGTLIAITINISIVSHFFIGFSGFSFYLFSIFTGVIPLILLTNSTYKKFFISFGISVASFIFVEILVSLSGVTLYFFQIRYGADQFPWAGDGFGMMISYLFCLSGGGIGTLAAFIITSIKKARLHSKSMEEYSTNKAGERK